MDAPVRVTRLGATCGLEGCDKPHKGHGYCEKHLDHFNRYGTPERGERKPSNARDNGTRHCDECEQDKPESDFYQDPKRGHFQRICKPCRKLRARMGHVLRKYGPEGVKIEKRLVAGEPCEICGEVAVMVIDHDHETGAPRGLLCQPHNAALGIFGDNIEMLQAAIDYLRSKA
jgi:hypothetical protein